MSNALVLLRAVVITSSLLANHVVGNSLPKGPHQKDLKLVGPGLQVSSLGGHHDVVSFTQAIPTFSAQASQEGFVAEKRAPIAKEKVTGTLAILTPATTNPNIFLNLLPAAPTTFSSVQHSGRMDCGACTLVFPTINVYCRPQNHTNARRLSQDSPAASITSKLSDIQSPSTYLVLPSVGAVNRCSQVGKTFTDVTASPAPSRLSIVRSDNIKPSFKFQDIPCPTSQADPDLALLEQLATADFLRGLDPAFKNCISGFDPIVKPGPRFLVNLPTAKHESPAGHHGHPHLHPPRDVRNLAANEP